MLLQQLSDAFGVSGSEDEVRRLLAETVRPYVDELHTDSMGNLIAVKRAAPHAAAERPPRVMVAAHMDEVGLMVTHIEKNGALRFGIVGGIDRRLLPAKRVRIGKDRVPGVIGMKPVHLLEPEEREKVLPLEQLSIDIGASSKEEAEKRVRVGDYAVFDTQFGYHGPEDEGAPPRLVHGKAFDDRAGCAVLAAVLQNGPYPVDLYGVFTVQEEAGLRGARVAAYALEPDIGIALEGTICDDLPKEKDQSPVTRVGAGPALTIADRSFVADRRLVRLFISTAEAEGIPYQIKEPGLGGTDAGAIHLTREGVPSIAVSVPSRYIHGPVSVLSLDDLERAAALVGKALGRLASWPEIEA